MPPPLPSQQGSRAGLITALVFFIILSLVFGLYAASFSSKLDREATARADVEKKLKDAAADLTATDYVAALDARDKLGVTTAFDAVERQRAKLATTITGIEGQPVPTDKAADLAAGALEEANRVLTAANIQPKERGLELSSKQSLISAIVQYANAYTRLEGEKKGVQATVVQLQKEVKDAIEKNKTDVASKEDAIKAAQAATQAETAKVEGIRTAAQGQNTALVADTSKQVKALSDAVAGQQTIVSQKDAELAKTRQQRDGAIKQLAPYRQNPKENIVRQADGAITRVTGDGFCYINRGEGDRIVVGLTFEVYDKARGIPPLGDGMAEDDKGKGAGRPAVQAADVKNVAGVKASSGAGLAALETELPKGKASIEVVSVGPGHTSQCRIIKAEPNQPLTEGDIIGNLVYDPTHKYTFAMYGDFDLDGNGVATSQDTAVIRRLVEQWGGRVVTLAKPEDLLVNADFVIMGLEPRVPTADPNDPIAVDAQAKAKAALDAYQAIRGRAAELSLPVMNQNRFLYYIGYYDQRTR